jgi:hypothetical protein
MMPQAIPKMLDVRFRTITRCANWMETNDRCIYTYFQKLQDKISANPKRDITDTEVTVLEDYMGNYITVRLMNKFIIDISTGIIAFLDHFESSKKILIHERYQRIVEFVFSLRVKFLTNAGIETSRDEKLAAKDLLNNNYKDKAVQKSNRRMYLGSKVDDFLVQLGLTRDSEELIPWLGKVREFYVEALDKCVKYLGPALNSKLLRYMDVLSPKAVLSMDVDMMQSKYKYIAINFSNVIKSEDIPLLQEEVALLKVQSWKVGAADMLLDTYFHEMGKLENGTKFPLISKLGLSCCTTYNSSSSAKRDFSIQVRCGQNILQYIFILCLYKY